MKIKQKENGFSLIEVVLTIILVGIIAGITGNLIMQGADSYSLQYNRRDLMYQAKTALSRMDREIRMIRSATAVDILTYAANDLEFINIDGDTIRFTLVGSNIVRTFNGVANTLCKDVSSFTFSYLKKDGTAAAVETEIWTIAIDLSVTGSDETISFRTRIFLRDVHGEYSGWREV